MNHTSIKISQSFGAVDVIEIERQGIIHATSCGTVPKRRDCFGNTALKFAFFEPNNYFCIT